MPHCIARRASEIRDTAARTNNNEQRSGGSRSFDASDDDDVIIAFAPSEFEAAAHANDRERGKQCGREKQANANRARGRTAADLRNQQLLPLLTLEASKQTRAAGLSTTGKCVLLKDVVGIFHADK